jgi:hypothetical protein
VTRCSLICSPRRMTMARMPSAARSTAVNSAARSRLAPAPLPAREAPMTTRGGACS